MAKYKIAATATFERQYKKMKKRGKDMLLMKEVVDCLAEGNPLPEKNRDHALTGNWNGYRECHILPDWIMIYQIIEERLILSLIRTGTHSDLFNK
ncbi:MAG: type II toxin-antitoxin system YafQ family toxin [Oscillospiraceae bacterium]|nr:type II toxin-antitoxin system YafQ family toxin [Oscillospiraceae bacterium]